LGSSPPKKDIGLGIICPIMSVLVGDLRSRWYCTPALRSAASALRISASAACRCALSSASSRATSTSPWRKKSPSVPAMCSTLPGIWAVKVISSTGTSVPPTETEPPTALRPVLLFAAGLGHRPGRRGVLG